MITNRIIDQAFSDLRSTCGGVRNDYFGLLYLEQEHEVPREKAVNHRTAVRLPEFEEYFALSQLLRHK